MWNNIISTYSRAEAIEDGVLIDVTEMAREAGFRFPVAVTETLWNGYIVPHSDANGQDEKGRIWDILTLAVIRARQCKGDTMLFAVNFLMEKSINKKIIIKSIIAPGDEREAVITLMLSEED